MPRKGPAPRRELLPDPIYRSVLVTQLVNKILSRGKRSVAERIVYDALDTIKERTAGEPISTLKRAVDNTKPQLEVKSRRVGGATYQVPVDVKPRRATTLSVRWLVGYSRQTTGKDHVRAAGQRTDRRFQWHWGRCEAPGGHAQDGRLQPGLRPLSLVTEHGAYSQGPLFTSHGLCSARPVPAASQMPVQDGGLGGGIARPMPTTH